MGQVQTAAAGNHAGCSNRQEQEGNKLHKRSLQALLGECKGRKHARRQRAKLRAFKAIEALCASVHEHSASAVLSPSLDLALVDAVFDKDNLADGLDFSSVCNGDGGPQRVGEQQIAGRVLSQSQAARRLSCPLTVASGQRDLASCLPRVDIVSLC